MPFDRARLEARRRERERRGERNIAPRFPADVAPGRTEGTRTGTAERAGLADVLAPPQTPSVSDPSGSMFSLGDPELVIAEAEERAAKSMEGAEEPASVPPQMRFAGFGGMVPPLPQPEPREPPTPLEELPGVAARGGLEMGRMMARGLAEIPEMMGELATPTSRPHHLPRTRMRSEQVRRGFGEISEQLRPLTEPRGAYKEFAERYEPRGPLAEIVHGVGQAPPLIASSLLSGGYAGPAAVGALAGGGAMAERVEKEPAAKDRQVAAKLAGYGLGLTEATPIGRLVNRLDKATGGVFRRALVESAKNTLEEGVQEAVQQAGEESVFQWAKGHPQDLRALRDVAVRGAEVGGPVGGVQAFLTTLLTAALPGRRAHTALPAPRAEPAQAQPARPAPRSDATPPPPAVSPTPALVPLGAAPGAPATAPPARTEPGVEAAGSAPRPLEAAAVAPAPTAPISREALEKARSVLARGRAERPAPAEIRAQGPRWLRRARASVLAEFSPLRAAEAEVHRRARQTEPGLGLDKKFELVAGAPGMAHADLHQFAAEVLRPAARELPRLEEYLLLRRIQARLEADPQHKRVGNWTLAEARAGLEALRAELGPERFVQIERMGGDTYQQAMDRALRLQVDSGRMSPKLYDTIKRENPFYAPFGVLKHLAERDAPERTGRAVATAQDLTKAIRGIDDPEFGIVSILERSARQIARSRILAEKNRAMLELANLAALDREGALVKKIATDARPRQGYRVVRYFDRGVERALEVHPELARAVQGLSRGESEFVGKVAALGQTALRAGATTFNVGFQMVNMPFADLPALALLSRYGVRSPLDAARFPFDVLHALYSSVRGNFGRPDDLYLRFLKSGAANSTISRVLRPAAFEAPPWARTRRFTSTVLDSAAKLTSALEETTKIAGYLRGERVERLRALSGEARARKLMEIASEVRNYAGSPDFARRGEMRDLNLWFMFFNARLQGAARDLAAVAGAKGGPRMAAAWARLAAAVGLPAVYLWYVNQRPENRDDYAERDEWERDNYFLIPMYGRDGAPRYVVNEQGERVRDYRRVPKREIVKLFAGTIEAGLDFLQREDPRAAAELPMKVFENLSPVGIAGEDVGERMESVVSSLNPLLRAPIEFGTGRSTFRHAPTVPPSLERLAAEEQYFQGMTSQAFVWLGRRLGVSPLKLEQLVHGLTGGGLTQLAPKEAALGRPGYSTWPGLYRFFGATRLSHRELYATLRQAEWARATLEKMAREGRAEAVARHAREHAHEIAALPLLKAMTDHLSQFRRSTRARAASGAEPEPGEGVYLTRGIRDILGATERLRRENAEQQRPDLAAGPR